MALVSEKKSKKCFLIFLLFVTFNAILNWFPKKIEFFSIGHSRFFFENGHFRTKMGILGQKW